LRRPIRTVLQAFQDIVADLAYETIEIRLCQFRRKAITLRSFDSRSFGRVKGIRRGGPF
jgi:hypothetical protein